MTLYNIGNYYRYNILTNDCCHLLNGLEIIFEERFLNETGHGLCDIRGMYAVVVGIGGVIMAFDAGKKFPDDYSI